LTGLGQSWTAPCHGVVDVPQWSCPCLMDREAWDGLTVRTRDGAVLGDVVGVFAEGPLAGRLLVQGDYALGGCLAGPQPGLAVYAIPRQAVERQLHDSPVLRTTLSAARARWLMHVTLMKGA
jgi:hypothetical protein